MRIMLKLGEALHKRGMKLITDQVFNHCGSEHWWMKDLPSQDWLNEWPEFTRSNYRSGSVSDPYVSQQTAFSFQGDGSIKPCLTLTSAIRI